MAILTFSKTSAEFLAGKKTVTRRAWAERTVRMWQKAWDEGRLIHDAWDKSPRGGGVKIGQFRLTARPYLERLSDMPFEDLEAEGGMCSSLGEYFKLIGKQPEDVVCVVRFVKVK